MFSEYIIEFFDTYAKNIIVACLFVHLFLMTSVTPSIMTNLKNLLINVFIALRNGLIVAIIMGTILYTGWEAVILIFCAFLNAVVYPTQYTR
jgi:hypothetical protein